MCDCPKFARCARRKSYEDCLNKNVNVLNTTLKTVNFALFFFLPTTIKKKIVVETIRLLPAFVEGSGNLDEVSAKW